MSDTLQDPMILPRRVDAKAVTRTLKTAHSILQRARAPPETLRINRRRRTKVG